jgi:8-oxo-dGTP pyrophosphatase MutT (NUDIX family)
MNKEAETETKPPEILRKIRVWPRDWRDQVLMGQIHGRTEIFVYEVMPQNNKSFWWQVPVSRDIVAAVAVGNYNTVYFVEQWRPTWEKTIWALPGGGVEKENASENDRKNTMRKELQQEIGYNCNKLEKLGTILCSARIKSRQHIYLATGLFQPQKDETCSDLENYEKSLQAHPRQLPFVEAYRKFVIEKEETTGYTSLGLVWAKMKLRLKI